MARRWQQHGIGVVCEKRLDLAIAFRQKQRAGAVKQTATGAQHSPQGLQHAFLDSSELGDVGFAPQPTHIGMAADDA